LPNPAGAQTTTTCPGAARSSPRVSRGRGRKDAETRGRVHFAGDTTGHPAMSTRRTLRPPQRADQHLTCWSGGDGEAPGRVPDLVPGAGG
jgi:hypothetical protein